MKHIPSAWLGGKGEGPVGWGLSGRGIRADFFVFMLNEIFSFNLCPSLMTLQLSLLFHALSSPEKKKNSIGPTVAHTIGRGQDSHRAVLT